MAAVRQNEVEPLSPRAFDRNLTVNELRLPTSDLLQGDCSINYMDLLPLVGQSAANSPVVANLFERIVREKHESPRVSRGIYQRCNFPKWAFGDDLQWFVDQEAEIYARPWDILKSIVRSPHVIEMLIGKLMPLLKDFDWGNKVSAAAVYPSQWQNIFGRMPQRMSLVVSGKPNDPMHLSYITDVAREALGALFTSGRISEAVLLSDRLQWDYYFGSGGYAPVWFKTGFSNPSLDRSTMLREYLSTFPDANVSRELIDAAFSDLTAEALREWVIRYQSSEEWTRPQVIDGYTEFTESWHYSTVISGNVEKYRVARMMETPANFSIALSYLELAMNNQWLLMISETLREVGAFPYQCEGLKYYVTATSPEARLEADLAQARSIGHAEAIAYFEALGKHCFPGKRFWRSKR